MRVLSEPSAVDELLFIVLFEVSFMCALGTAERNSLQGDPIDASVAPLPYGARSSPK